MPVPARLSVQQSIEEFLFSGHRHDKDHGMLFNPLSAEFGVRTADEMDSFISSALPDFKLVKLGRKCGAGCKYWPPPCDGFGGPNSKDGCDGDEEVG